MKLGSFYEVYYQDAIVAQVLLDLKFQGGVKSGKLRCGFLETALDKNISTLVNAGYKVAVIECTETRRQKEQR